MESVYYNIFGFCVSASLIVYSGSRLSHFADKLADLKGWGKMFMGIILLASITSLPELVTGFSAVTLIGAPDMAVGDILGSCAFNILIISIMDYFYDPKKSLTSAANQGHIITAALSIILLSFVGAAIVFPDVFGHIGWVGGYSFVLLALYIIAIRIVYRYEVNTKNNNNVAPVLQAGSARYIIGRLTFHASVVVTAALFLPYFGEHIAEAYDLGKGIFGTLFLAVSTSLPEIVVSVSAIRMGVADMAIGNIFGSNLFNIAILSIDDILYRKGPILSYTSSNHIITLLGTIVITSIGVIGIVFKTNAKWKLTIDTALIVCVYVAMMLLLFSFQ